MPNWTPEGEAFYEKVDIDPEKFLKEAREHVREGDFYSAERKYINAYTNARGTSDEKRIAKIVKNGLSEIYRAWASKCERELNFQEAEPVLLKYCAVTEDKTAAKHELSGLYCEWGSFLLNRDKNIVGAIAVFVKDLRLQIDLKTHKDFSVEMLCKAKYYTLDKADEKQADALYATSFTNRIRMIITVAVLTLFSILTVIFAPSSSMAYIFVPFVYLMLDTRECWMLEVRIKKRIWKPILLTLFGIIACCASYDSALIGVIVFVIEVFLSIRLIRKAIKFIKLLFTYNEKDCLNVAEGFEKKTVMQCKSCGEKAMVATVSTSDIKCPKCKSLLKEKTDLRIKNKPVIHVEEDNSKSSGNEGLNRMAFHAGRFITKEILQNLLRF